MSFCPVNGTGIIGFENWMGCSFAATTGGVPIFAALVVFGFFLGFTLLQGTRMEAKFAILTGAFILAAVIGNAPWLLLILCLVAGWILYRVLLRMTQG